MSLFSNLLSNETAKVYAISTISWISTITSMDVVLKAILLVVSIIYTIAKTFAILRDEIKRNKKND